jgi:hypothetical protein
MSKQEQIMEWLLSPAVTLARKGANPTAQASRWFREAKRYPR